MPFISSIIRAFRSKELIVIIGDADLIAKAKTELNQISPTSNLFYEIGLSDNRTTLASFHPGYPVAKDGIFRIPGVQHRRHGASQLIVVLCNINKQEDPTQISSKLVEHLCGFGDSVIWITGVWSTGNPSVLQHQTSTTDITAPGIAPAPGRKSTGPEDIQPSQRSPNPVRQQSSPVLGESRLGAITAQSCPLDLGIEHHIQPLQSLHLNGLELTTHQAGQSSERSCHNIPETPSGKIVYEDAQPNFAEPTSPTPNAEGENNLDRGLVTERYQSHQGLNPTHDPKDIGADVAKEQPSVTGTKTDDNVPSTNVLPNNADEKGRELVLRNTTIKASLKKGARYGRWTEDRTLQASLRALILDKGNLNRDAIPKAKGFKFTGENLVTEVEDSLELSEDDFVIAVMGPTGAGKSTFIKNATGYNLRIGNDLESCTSEIHIIRLIHEDAKIYIVDTPGFNDTNRSDLEIFKQLSLWLKDRFTNQVYLSGLIYLHRISDNRMGGTTFKNLQIFEQLCGKDCFHNVTLVTTMWDDVESPEIGAIREEQLRGEYFAEMIRKGARMVPLKNDPASAKALIAKIIQDSKSLRPLALQKELVAYQKNLPETNAGRQMYSKLDDVVQSLQKALQQLSRDMQTEDSEQVRNILRKEHTALTQELITLVADMRYMKLGLPARFMHVVSSLLGDRDS